LDIGVLKSMGCRDPLELGDEAANARPTASLRVVEEFSAKFAAKLGQLSTKAIVFARGVGYFVTTTGKFNFFIRTEFTAPSVAEEPPYGRKEEKEEEGASERACVS
jgi:hypothetical protein